MSIIAYASVVILLGGVISPSIASYVKKHYYIADNTKQNETVEKGCLPTKDGIIDCQYDDGQATAIVIGDSHAQSIATSIRSVNPGKTILWSRGGCPTLEGYHFKSKSETAICHAENEKIFKRLETQFPKVPLFIINRASLYTDPIDLGGHLARFDNVNENDRKKYLETYHNAYLNTVCKLAKNRPVYIIKPIPEMRTNVVRSLKMQKHFVTHLNDITLPIEQYYDRQDFILKLMSDTKNQCNVKLLDPTPYLCPDGKVCIGSISGEPVYEDDNHLNIKGSKLLAPLFKPLFNKNESPQQ